AASRSARNRHVAVSAPDRIGFPPKLAPGWGVTDPAWSRGLLELDLHGEIDARRREDGKEVVAVERVVVHQIALIGDVVALQLELVAADVPIDRSVERVLPRDF